MIAEIESNDSPHFFFVDDSLVLNRNAAKQLFTEMIPLRRRWLAQGTVSLAEDPELLGLMKRAGCLGLLIGFESVQKETQDEVNKIKNLRVDFYEAMRRFHGEGFGREYPPDTLLFQPKGMTPEGLISGFARLNRKAYFLKEDLARFVLTGETSLSTNDIRLDIERKVVKVILCE